MTEFKKENSTIRILFATEAAGMGVDISDVTGPGRLLRGYILYLFQSPTMHFNFLLQRGAVAVGLDVMANPRRTYFYLNIGRSVLRKALHTE